MSEDKVKRRRFLADLLFAGGVMSAAALLAKAMQTSPEGPQSECPSGTTATPATAPSAPPAPPEPVLGGKPAMPAPEVRVKGEAVMPQPKQAPPEAVIRGRVSLPRPKKS